MEALILDREMRTQCIIDGFESFIWAERYNKTGDFEIYMPVERAPLDYIKREYFVWLKSSDRLQVIEDIEIKTDVEEGDHLTFTGRTLESWLDRRVVFQRTIINGNLQNGIEQILNENAINPIDPNRKIPKLRFVRNDDSRVTKLTMDVNYLGENLLTLIEDLCDNNDLGFKIVWNEEADTFDFSLYYGKDHSYAQEENPWVVFSSNYDNLVGTDYYESYANLKTAAMIASSEDDEEGQEVVDVDGRPGMTGLDRREMFVDGSSVERPETEVDEEKIRAQTERRFNTANASVKEKYVQAAIASATAAAEAASLEQFRAQLRQLGEEELKKTYITESFNGEIEAALQYVYNRDFFLGDVVQVRNQYGKEASSRITEIVRSHDVSGELLTPTFTTLIGGDNKGDIENPDLG